MFRIFTLCSLFLLNLSLVHSQLTIDNTTQNPTDLVQNVLVGAGVTVTNVKFNGSTASALVPQEMVGEFSGITSMGITNGLILATGNAQLADSDNNNGGATSGGTGAIATDPDLNALSGLVLYDQAMLEFDFVPAGDSISFKFVFGSEEYLEWVGSGYNDVFGFFLSGPGITGPFSAGGVNLATVPFTSTPISINTINNVTSSTYYVNNGTGSTPAINLYIQYDGFTVILTAKAAVNCGDTYHIKLAISDAGDAVLDSGVFLEGGSFSSDAVTVDLVTTSGSNIIAEGCSQGGTFSFTRPASASGDTLIIDVFVSGDAINGLDYSPYIDSTITFLPGEDSVGFTFLAIDDFLLEGTDSLVITIYNVNSCGDTVVSTAVVYIVDLKPLIVDLGPDTLLPCGGGTVSIDPFVAGGYIPYTYSWSTGATTDSLDAPITSTTTIYLTVNGLCGTNATDSMIVNIASTSPQFWDPQTFDINCPDSVEIAPLYVSGGAAPFSFLWSTGVTDSSIIVSPIDTTTYTVTITDFCGQVMTLNIVVNSSSIPMVWNPQSHTIFCPNAVDIAGLFVSGGATPFSYSWSTGETDSSINVSPIVTTNYTVTISDVCSQSSSLTIPVTVQFVPQFWNPQTYDIVCPDTAVIGPVFVSGGVSPFTYSWSTGPTTSTITVSPNDTTIYTVTITDACAQTAVVNIPVNVDMVPLDWDSQLFSTYCPFTNIEIEPMFVSGTSPFSYSWSTGGSSSSIFVSPGDTTIYVVTISDACGQSEIVNIQVDVRAAVPIDVEIGGDTICLNTDGTLTVVPIVTGGNGGVNYNWYEDGAGVISNIDANGVVTIITPANSLFIITVTDICLMSDADTVDIVVEPCEITIPNIFTPNGDGLNDYFFIINLDVHPNSGVTIFNRWGQVMYNNGNYLNDWDGGEVSDGVYFYIVKLTDGTIPADYHGTVQIAGNK